MSRKAEGADSAGSSASTGASSSPSAGAGTNAGGAAVAPARPSTGGWRHDDVLRDLWAWFSSLSTRERVEVMAIEDPLWTRFYLFL